MKSTLTAPPCFVWVTFLLPLLLSSCGGSNSDKSDAIVNPPDIEAASHELEQGVLLDSVVIGARYDAGGGVTGNTDANGLFNYRPGNAVTFYIGELKLGTAKPVDRPEHLTGLKADKMVTPVELAGENARLDDPATLNIARLLIVVDEDSDPSNGIALSSSVISRSSGAGDVDYDNDASVVAAIRHLNNDVDEIGPIPDRSQAKQHLCISIRSADCETTTIPPISAATDGSSSQGTTTQGTTTPVPTTPVPTTPVPTTPGPATPGPATPGPATPGPATPGPATPGPTTPVPTTPVPTTPVPTTPVPATPGPATPDPATPVPATPVPATPVPATPVPTTPVPTTPVPTIPVPTTPGLTTQGPTIDQESPPNQPPSIDGVPQTEIIAGETYDFIPEATDSDGDSLTFAIDGMPSWASFDTGNGTLTGAPLESDVGVVSQIAISVSDGKAVSHLAPFSLRVTESNTPPVFSGEPTTRIKSGETYRFTPVASD